MFAKSLLAIIGYLSIMPLTGHTALLNFNESVDGDLNGQTLLLDAGINKVSGEWSLFFPATSDSDFFWITIPQNMELTNVTYTFDDSGVLMPSGWSLTSQYVIAPFTSDKGNLLLPGTTSPQTFFASTLPISEGTYRLVQNLAFLTTSGTDITSGDGGAIPYTWSFTVVPVPAAVWLFVSGLIGLAGVAIRKKAA